MSHLSDADLAEALDGRTAPALSAHLAGCGSCRADLDALSRDLDALRAVHHGRVPSEPHWMKGRSAVRRRLAERPALLRPSFAVGALAAATLLVALLAPTRPGAVPASTPSQVATTTRTEVPDDALLLEAESFAAGSPAPLAVTPEVRSPL